MFFRRFRTPERKARDFQTTVIAVLIAAGWFAFRSCFETKRAPEMTVEELQRALEVKFPAGTEFSVADTAMKEQGFTADAKAVGRGARTVTYQKQASESGNVWKVEMEVDAREKLTLIRAQK